MTLEKVVLAASMCAKDRGLECRNNKCPLYGVDYCIRELLGYAVTYLSMYQKGIPLDAEAPAGGAVPLKNSAPCNPASDLIGEIMGHYKKPFVSIEINISEDET